ncbi:protein RALF-like 32 isoform X2 [Herrania umbratica]|nr:protein RALF-like 32 isoform X2 [Herrania umbratica]
MRWFWRSALQHELSTSFVESIYQRLLQDLQMQALTLQLIQIAMSLVSDAYMPCNGSIGECNEANEMLMESEISRRFLEQKKYISPGALKRDQPVCSGGSSGEAYSKTEGCLPQPSNPYNRGCSKYYRCR